MNIVRNDRFIKMRSRIGLAATFVGLAVLAGGMFISFKYPTLFSVSLIALLVGFVLSQVGIYFSNRFGRSPRPDEMIDLGLKGLDGKYTIYHYTSPVAHLLIGPAGVWILQPHHQKGEITYAKGRWRQRGGNWYLKIFAQEGLGRPDMEAGQEVRSLQRFFDEKLGDEKMAPINTAIVFLHPDAVVNIADDVDAPAASVHIKDLKELIRKSAKSKSLSPLAVTQIQQVLEATD